MLIQNEYELNIYVDELNIFDAPGVVFISGEILEAICSPIPTCKLKMSIPLNWIDQRSIVDGTIIRFEIKNEKLKVNENLKFRLFNVNKVNINQQFVTVEIEGILDFYEGYTSGNKYNLYGNSSDVFENVAKRCNLVSEIDKTTDTQLWVAGENNLYRFMMNVASHGWIDETSAMFWCMDRHSILMYKDLTSMFRKRSANIYTFIQSIRPNPEEKLYGYSLSDVSIQSGYENIENQGYGGEDHCFSLLDYDWKQVVARKVIAESNIINITKDVSDGLAQTWYPFDVGNFHENYHKAKKQNTRILSTYSTYVNLLCQYFMPYRLGQIVNFLHTDSEDLDNVVVLTSGVYMITTIKINMSMKNITANLQLVMQGLNGKAVTRETF